MYCHHCGEVFINLKKRTEHEQKEHTKSVKQEEKIFSMPTKNSPLTIPPKPAGIICLLCPQTFINQDNYQVHLEIHKSLQGKN